MSASLPSRSATPPKRSMTMFWLVVLVCVAPVIASYFLYYGVRPEGRTNYGTLLEPQVPVADVATLAMVRATRESGFVDVLAALPAESTRNALSQLGDFRGRWLLVRLGPAACDDLCQKQLWVMRQLRLTTGRDRDRVERLWLVTDDGTPEPDSLADYEGTWVVRVDKNSVAQWPDEPASGVPSGAPSGKAEDLTSSHLWLVDPLGNLMMRFPLDPDPAKMKKDLLKLLKASRVG